MNNLPLYVPVLFIATTGLACILFLKALPNTKRPLLILSLWLMLQAVLALTGFYSVTTGFPPRMAIALLPPLLLIFVIFSTDKGRDFLTRLDGRYLTLLHCVRLPVEIALFFLLLVKAVPQRMTFEGGNFDIFSGLTAPLVYYFGYVRKNLGRSLLLFWNFLCLGLLVYVVSVAALSIPGSFQKLSFEQPNIAVLYFPFNWLASVVVPLVLFAHLASIRQLLIQEKKVRSIATVQSKAA